MTLFRGVMNRAKPLGLGWVGRRHLQLRRTESGGVVGSTVAENCSSCLAPSIPVINQSCLRRYFLPPAPSLWILGDRAVFGRRHIFELDIESVLPAAEFAVMTNNTAEEGKIRLVRVVRASYKRGRCYKYYLTLEGIDENDDDDSLNVYYAEVHAFDTTKQLLKWQLVDHSFSYPYWETGVVRNIAEKFRHNVEGYRNMPRAWLASLTLDYHNGTFGDATERSYVTAPCSSSSYNEIEVDTRGPHVTPIYEMVDCGKIVNHALSALKRLNKQMGKETCLKEVLHASKEEVDGKVYYILLLKAMNEQKEFTFLYAIAEVSQIKEELIKWHVVDELCSDPLEINKIAAEKILPHPKKKVHNSRNSIWTTCLRQNG
ncbi:OLC1v1003915C1 [Oldenlandia corymbosa var. corymbosa]|uniref:OLC1v1003915C1 n=1 Tax=Oldenlandia corymbosa var. corymbosa TaxID=529605 RepID=A0AAV1DCW8_OLDCO|nr:OLC1v1003915C1 [Oldenlandia corymbosa var. corymbosa]